MQIGTDIPVHSIQQNTSATAVCTESISCDDTYARIAPGVVGINCVDPVSKTSGLCTGAHQQLLATPPSDFAVAGGVWPDSARLCQLGRCVMWQVRPESGSVPTAIPTTRLVSCLSLC